MAITLSSRSGLWCPASRRYIGVIVDVCNGQRVKGTCAKHGRLATDLQLSH
jgi:hypothetical protein